MTFDVGDTTGWAKFEDSELLQTGVFNPHGVSTFLTKDRWPADLVVIEVPALRRSPARASFWTSVVREINQRYVKVNVYEVGPGTWKPRFDKAELPRKIDSQHERDAVRIGFWALNELARGRLHV